MSNFINIVKKYSRPEYHENIINTKNYNDERRFITLRYFTSNNITMRSFIFLTFILNKEKLLKSIFQGEYNTFKKQISTTSTNIEKQNTNSKFIDFFRNDILQTESKTSTDIILSFAFYKKLSYEQSTLELFNHIKNNVIYNTNSSKIIQELHPLNSFFYDKHDDLHLNLKNSINIHIYRNISSSVIGYNIVPKTEHQHQNNITSATKTCSIFYAMYKFKNTTKLFLLPNHKNQSIMFFNIENAHKYQDIIILEDEISVISAKENGLYNCISIFIQDKENIKGDFTTLRNKNLIIGKEAIKYYESSTVLKLAKILKEHNTNIYYLNKYGKKNQIPPPSNISRTANHRAIASAFSEIGAPIVNSSRKREYILSPIIKNGTITWLFAKEKTGKTLLALTLAYMIGKGNKTMHTWSTSSPKKVLYIDGEMSGDFLNELCQKICFGFSDNAPLAPPFATYLFSEDEAHYNSILDSAWLERYKEKLFSYDLIVLDNYHSLNENKINIKAFLKLLRELKQSGIATLVVDHTNKEGELQGSISKRRTADLGLKVENISKTKIEITYEFDRHGVGIEDDTIHLEKIFTSKSFTFLPYEQTKIQSPQAQLSEDEKLQLYCYALREYHSVPLPELEKIIDRSQPTISNYHNNTAKQLEGTEPQRNKLRNLELAKEFLTDIKDMTKEQKIEAISKYALPQVKDF